MSTKEKALACLETLPAEAEAWQSLWEDALRFQAIAQAEEDIRAGKVHSPADVRHQFEEKWKPRP